MGAGTLELRSTVPVEWPWGPRRFSFPVEKEVSHKNNQDGLKEGSGAREAATDQGRSL